MADRQDIVEAIATLQSQRPQLGDEVVDAALWALRQKLATLSPEAPHPPQEQQHQLAILVADLSGFTAMSSSMDAEHVGDAINTIWQHVDGVIDAWGGQVDKHVGDGLIAHFGLPLPRRDDAERAVMAALEIQRAFAWLSRRLQAGGRENGFPVDSSALQMRIGVHVGEVFVGTVGESENVSAVGDAVTIANALEEAAPLGGVLISDAVWRRVRGRFDVHSAESLLTPDEKAYLSTYVVEQQTPHPYHAPMQGVAGVETRFVGRTAELEQLQEAFQMVADASLAQMVAVVGEIGIGKTRVLDALQRWLDFFPQPVALFRGQQFGEQLPNPFALMQDIFSAYATTQTRYSDDVARAAILEELVPLLQQAGLDPTSAETRAHAIGQLMGHDFSAELGLNGTASLITEQPQVLEMAVQGIAALIQAVTADGTVAIFFLEDIDSAHPALLDLLERLIEACVDSPLLMVCTAEPDLLQVRPQWLEWADDPFGAYTLLELGPLSAIDARHLVNELLQKLGRVPLRLVDIIVSVAAGNPFHIEQTVNYLIENGVIANQSTPDVVHQNGEPWQVRLGRLDDLRLPASPRDVIQQRLQRLPAGERVVLQRGSVFGRLFPDLGIGALGQDADDLALSAEDIEAALIALETKGFVRRSATAVFPRAQDYFFGSAAWWQTAYGSLPETMRQRFHRQVAYWLVANGSSLYLRRCGSQIAHHFRVAGEVTQAEKWASGLGRGAATA